MIAIATTMSRIRAPGRSLLLAGLLLVGLLSAPDGCLAKTRFNVQTHAIYVEEPSDLSGDYEGAIGDFGVPLYGGSLAGEVRAPSTNRDGCDAFEDGAFEPAGWTDDDDDTPIIAMLERGGCYFVQKAYHAQLAGASAVIIADDRDEPLITMTTPKNNPSAQSLVREIEVPTALVRKRLADTIDRVLRSGDRVVLEMNWEEAMPNPDDRVEWELWTTSNDACGASCEAQAEFKQDAANAAVELQTHGFTSFVPHYKVRACDKMGLFSKEDCDRACIHGGRYCAVDHVAYPLNETVSGRDIVLENKRQLCIYDYLKREDQDHLWWRYVADFARKCRTADGNFGEACSRQVQRSLAVAKPGALVRDVERCMGDSMADTEHPLLERERTHELERFKAGQGRITFLPTVIINTVQYRGRLDSASVLRGICAGFEELSEPGICLQDSLQVDECSTGHGCWINPDERLRDQYSSTCLDTFRGHICVCPKGYLGDGYECEEMSACALGTADCDHLLDSWGVTETRGPVYTALEIVLITFLSVLILASLGYVYYRCFHKKRMDREIRTILEQYMPLEDKAEAERKQQKQQEKKATTA